MEKNTLLSIIIPLYNCEKYIAQCLDSIFMQCLDEADFEVIVIDDGSKDNSHDIVSEYAENHDNIQVVKQENQGVACTRNNALKMASGDYVTFVDADDMLVEGSLKALLNIARENKADIVKGAHIEVSQETVLKDYSNESQSNTTVEVKTGGEAIVKVTKLKEGYCWGYLISRKLIIDNNIHFPPQVSFMEDWAFITQAILKSATFVNTDILFYLYRNNAASCVANMSTEKLLLGCRSIDIVANVAHNTEGAVKKKLMDNVCANINIVLWFTIHYRSIFCDRKTISRELTRLFKLVQPQYVPRSLKIFRLCPRLFILIRHLIAKRKY